MKIKAIIDKEFDTLEQLLEYCPESVIIEVDDKEYFGKCVDCGKLMFSGDYYLDMGEENMCAKCASGGKHVKHPLYRF